MDIVGNGNMYRLWDELARTYGEKTALICEDACGRCRRFSYAALNEETNRAANLFRELGVAKGDRVVVHLHNSPEFLLAWFGLAKIGAVMVPVNAHYLESECAYILEKCAPTVVLTEERFLGIYRNLKEKDGASVHTLLAARCAADREFPDCINFNEGLTRQSPELADDAGVRGHDTAEILFTSGTTSKPKGVVITLHNLLMAGRYTAWQCNLGPEDRYMTMMPVWHIDFQCTAAMPAFTVGATFILLEKYSARRFWSQVCCYRATITECIPLMIRTLLLQPRAPWERNHCLREVFFYLTLSDCEKDAFVERFNVRLLTSYGMTETIVGILGDRPGDERRWPSIGRPGMGYEARIVDENGAEVPPGVMGEICIKGEPGKTILKEYYNDPEETAKVLSPDGWLLSGDRGYMDEDGFFYFVDRQSNLIKRSGENISSTEVENFLVTHPKIVDAAVVGVPHDICDETLKAFVIAREGETLCEEEVLDYCRRNIARFKVPASVEVRASLPRTSTGKVRKNVLREECLAACAEKGPAEPVPED